MLEAARHYRAFFAGEDTLEADVAGVEFAELVALAKKFIRDHYKDG